MTGRIEEGKGRLFVANTDSASWYQISGVIPYDITAEERESLVSSLISFEGSFIMDGSGFDHLADWATLVSDCDLRYTPYPHLWFTPTIVFKQARLQDWQSSLIEGEEVVESKWWAKEAEFIYKNWLARPIFWLYRYWIKFWYSEALNAIRDFLYSMMGSISTAYDNPEELL